MNKEEFTKMVANARPNDKIVYAKGWLGAHNREISRAALRAYAEGSVELLQKRIFHGVVGLDGAVGCGMFEYIAVKKRYRQPPINSKWLHSILEQKHLQSRKQPDIIV
jgi:hypothetical protein